jgi:hypothetical protein
MIGQTISHYPALWDSATGRDSRKRNKILDKLGEGGMSQNGLRTSFVSGSRFEDPRLPQRLRRGGQATKRPPARRAGSGVGGGA